MPITMPASPVTMREHGLLAAALPIEPVSSTTAGGLRGTAEHPALGEVAEHRGDRAVVLLGQHLGGRQQGRLAAGVDDLQHRAQRDEGLAGADLTLEQPVHRVGAGELGRDELADLALAAGELERQPGVERRQQPVVASRPGLRTRRPVGRAPSGEHELEHQRLLEAEALLGRAELAPLVGRVDPAQGLGDGRGARTVRGARA